MSIISVAKATIVLYNLAGDIMVEFALFKNVTEEELEKALKCFNAKKISFKRDQTILSNIKNAGTIGVVLSGTAQLIRLDYAGTRTILTNYNAGDVFGDIFSNISGGEISVIAKENVEILFLDYDHIINRCKKNCNYHNTIIQNMIEILSKRIYKQNERIEILTKRSIRDKLLEYFNLCSKKTASKVIYLPFTFTDLADFLSIDRSAMMREIKNLKEDGMITTKGKIIHLKI